MGLILHRAENIVGLGRNAGFRHFPFSYFSAEDVFLRDVKIRDHEVKVNQMSRFLTCSIIGPMCRLDASGSVFTNHSQEHSLSFSPRFVNLNVTQHVIG